MNATATTTLAVLFLQNPQPSVAPPGQPGQAAEAASWIAFAVFLAVMAPVALWVLSRFAKLIVLAERDDPYDQLYLEDDQGRPMQIPLGLKRPGDLGYRPDLDPKQRSPNAGPPTGPG